MAGIPAPSDLQGESFVPVLKTGKTPKNARKAIYYRYSGERTHNVAPHDGVRTERHKLMYFPSTKEWNLFDLKRDPDEMRSVHDDPGYAKALSELKALYTKLKTDYKAPEW
jgi:arylsulfatase A-like enzyme